MTSSVNTALRAGWVRMFILISAGLLGLSGCASTSSLPFQQQAQWQEQALTYYRHGDLLAAESVLQQLVNTYPNDAESWFLLGNIQLRQLRIEAARSAYEQALLIQPNFNLARYNLALTYLRLATTTLIAADENEDLRSEALLEHLLRLQGASSAQL